MGLQGDRSGCVQYTANRGNTLLHRGLWENKTEEPPRLNTVVAADR